MKTNNETTNLFKFEEDNTVPSTSRQIELTPELNRVAHQRAIELVKIVSAKDRPELHSKAQKMTEGNVTDCMNLINEVFDDETMKQDAYFLNVAGNDILDRLLESRRSDRSKTKAKGLTKNMSILLNYIAATYAEMMIRLVSGKSYKAPSDNEILVDEQDKDAITRKIKSLQSKKSRLSKIAQYDATARIELDQVNADIERLNALRGTAHVTTKQIIQDTDIDTLRKVLDMLDVNGMSPEQQVAYNMIKDKIAK